MAKQDDLINQLSGKNGDDQKPCLEMSPGSNVDILKSRKNVRLALPQSLEQ